MTNTILRLDFNTGRTYSKEGQPMVAVYKPDEGLVRFADLARSMHGEFEWTGEKDPQIIQEVILHRYDRAEYEVNQMTRCFYMFEKKVWNDVQKEKNRSKASRQVIEQIQKLAYMADDIRAQLEEIDPFEDLEFTDPDADEDLDMREELIDLADIAGQLSDQLAELQETAKEVTK